MRGAAAGTVPGGKDVRSPRTRAGLEEYRYSHPRIAVFADDSARFAARHAVALIRAGGDSQET
jgi:hypothetical protein